MKNLELFTNLGNEEWQNIVIEVINEVVNHFYELYNSLDFGVYISPQEYFVSYIFETESELDLAKENGLLIEITQFHKLRMQEKGYPLDAIKDCLFASMEDCEKECKGNWYYYYK